MKPRLLIPAALLAATFAGCSGGDDHLSQGKMADVIADLKLAEAYAASAGISSDSARTVLRNSILSNHGVSQEEFDRSLDWYGHNLDKYIKLCDEVDKKLDKRQKSLLASSGADSESKEGSLWPYSKMAMISPRGATDAINFSIPISEFEQGDRLKWLLRLSSSTPVQMVLGVDYKEGGTSYLSRRFSERRIEMTLQTDSSRNVSRIYGYLTVDSRSSLPVWADSITLTRLPLAKETYYMYMQQSSYNGPSRPGKKDSTESRPPTVKPIRENTDAAGDINIESQARPGAPAPAKPKPASPPKSANPRKGSMSGEYR